MVALFQVCLVLGGVVLMAQILLNLVGVGAEGMDAALPADTSTSVAVESPGDDPGAGASDALNLLSVRAVAAGVAMFGAAGLALRAFLPDFAAAVLAVGPAFAVMTLTAWATRQMRRMDTSGTLLLSGAVGLPGTVYLTVPAGSRDDDGYGVVHVALQGRTTELRAVTPEAAALPSGTEVVVISLLDDGSTAEVVLPSTFEAMIR